MTLLFSGILIFFSFGNRPVEDSTTKRMAIYVKNHTIGAPVTMGIPFPKGCLHSVDHLRLTDSKGNTVPCQFTEVSTWEPADESIKWIWLFFFAKREKNYFLEYGKHFYTPVGGKRIISTNNMRKNGGMSIDTGILSFKLNKQGSGFLDEVFLDIDEDGHYSDKELIASGAPDKRGVFLDILDDTGIDFSKAKINAIFREKGSGRLHTVFRVEGMYFYQHKDNNPAPFTLRIHAYAGKSYIKVQHTFVYTGVPDKHTIQKGEHALIATQNKHIVSEETANDPGWTQANDRIQSCGLKLKYHINRTPVFSTALCKGKWYDDDAKRVGYSERCDRPTVFSLLQTGAKPGIFKSGGHHDDFKALIRIGNKTVVQEQRAAGWVDISDSRWGISIGIKNFFEEYPKEIGVDVPEKQLIGYVWPSNVAPMNFARSTTDLDGGMLDNFAQGLAKTTEFVYYFHKGDVSKQTVIKHINYVLDPPIAHAAVDWYAQSKVYGNIAPMALEYPEYENALQNRFDWWLFNQKKEPWYGMFDYGDGKTHFYKNKWHVWTNNEPAIDFMFWMNFIRTGHTKYFKAAESMSRHTMDVDNIHWPAKKKYIGDQNDALSYWDYKDQPESTPYLGIGRRHANQHWLSLLSAHVWLQGWITAYYLTANHRALEVARKTGDTYLKRIWGKHGLTGRRLYLSVWNLSVLYDATKDEMYFDELQYRVKEMLRLQKIQGGNLLLDRYGYSQPYVALGLYKYYQLTHDKKLRKALITHARWLRDVPPLNHKMESYLASIYPLILGYEFTKNKSFLDEAVKRAAVLKVTPLNKPVSQFETQKELSDALLKSSHLPPDPDSQQGAIWQVNQGLRVFGWTHAYTIPYLLYQLQQNND